MWLTCLTKSHFPLSPGEVSPSPPQFHLNIPEGKFCEHIQLDQSRSDGLTPTPAVRALGLEIAEERAKAEADAFAEAKKKLEGGIRDAKKFLEARQEKVSQTGNAMGFQQMTYIARSLMKAR